LFIPSQSQIQEKRLTSLLRKKLTVQKIQEKPLLSWKNDDGGELQGAGLSGGKLLKRSQPDVGFSAIEDKDMLQGNQNTMLMMRCSSQQSPPSSIPKRYSGISTLYKQHHNQF